YLSLYQQNKRLKSVLALCFTQVTERYHHWRVFANGSSGVCIAFKKPELLKAIDSIAEIRKQSVNYLTLNQIRDKILSVEELPFLKRAPFGDEEEFRVIYESKTKKLTSFDVEIPLECIDKITLSPWLHPRLSESVKELIRCVDGCEAVRISRST